MFFAYVKMEGGCDYTIACGEELIPLKSNSFEDAEIEIENMIPDRFTDDYELSSIKILEGTLNELDCDGIYNKIKEREEREAVEEQERENYEKLKKKFEGTSCAEELGKKNDN